MFAKIICMASAKGGSGKTILTATFGAFLAALGKKVLLIDTDAATNGLTLLYLKEVMTRCEFAIAEGRKPRGIYERLPDSACAEVTILNNGVHLIPATYTFLDTELTPLEEFKVSISAVLKDLRESYEFVFLDAQSGSDEFAQYCMNRNVSDEVVIVSEYDPMSAAGVERLKGLLREDLTYVRTWVLLNKMLPEFVQSFSDFLEVAKYLNPIPWDADVVKAYARRRLALDLDNGNEHTLAIMQATRTLFGEQIAAEVDAWRMDRATAIRQPLETQFHDLELELDALVRERFRISRSLERRRTFRLAASVGLGIALMGVGWGILEVSSAGKAGMEWLTWKTVLSAGVAISVLVATFVSTRGLDAPEAEIEEARIRRREGIVEQKLKRLETLRTADLETLVKTKQQVLHFDGP